MEEIVANWDEDENIKESD